MPAGYVYVDGIVGGRRRPGRHPRPARQGEEGVVVVVVTVDIQTGKVITGPDIITRLGVRTRGGGSARRGLRPASAAVETALGNGVIEALERDVRRASRQVRQRAHPTTADDRPVVMETRPRDASPGSLVSSRCRLRASVPAGRRGRHRRPARRPTEWRSPRSPMRRAAADRDRRHPRRRRRHRPGRPRRAWLYRYDGEQLAVGRSSLRRRTPDVTAADVALDPDRIFDGIRTELPDAVIIDLAVRAEGEAALVIDATVVSEQGGTLLVLLSPRGCDPRDSRPPESCDAPDRAARA
ncbi:MAG: hypothetical protein R2697_22385 [Ilumatobacteraceae bacterium]